MINVTFFTTAGCHLCEQAQQLLAQCQSYQLTITTTDIALNDQLSQLYGTSIPVIQFSDGSELKWPFDLPTLKAKLNAPR